MEDEILKEDFAEAAFREEGCENEGDDNEFQDVVVDPRNLSQSIEIGKFEKKKPPFPSSEQVEQIHNFVNNNVVVESDKVGVKGKILGHLSFDLNKVR